MTATIVKLSLRERRRGLDRLRYNTQLLERLRIPGEHDDLSMAEFQELRHKYVRALLHGSNYKSAARMTRRNQGVNYISPVRGEVR